MDQKTKAREFIYGVLRAFDDEIIDLADRPDSEASFQIIKAAASVRDRFFDGTRDVPLDLESVHAVLIRAQATLSAEERAHLAPVLAQIAVQKDYLDEAPAAALFDESSIPDLSAVDVTHSALEPDRLLARAERVLRGLTLEVASKAETPEDFVSAVRWIQGRRDAITDVVIESWMLGRESLGAKEGLPLRVLGQIHAGSAPDLIQRVLPLSGLPRLVEDLAGMAEDRSLRGSPEERP